ncbi:hypothetical protein F8388_007438 [Cannabis sativa]|uniref:Myb-like domain-containing protein n=1 Tax=Cannabis sativa TaxID=3483 RepID=A0A7J6E684_CANSA|nr:hypothetical protein G4B88_009395 [Cannabis sativa]KAF4365605.1 hypothetical protein F8388_007438 [Cannabis sativa]KAF4390459.1 hypothetical protein G4B88_024465 [Cannabis sativa]
MDAKDILGLPKNALPVAQEKKSRPQKDSHRKPDGISREVYALTGGVPPLMPSIDLSQLRKRPPADEKITWQWLPFTSSARKDNLQLYHWSVDIVQYTDEEYEKHLTDPAWTKEETDQLFSLCKQFDLRFIIIADRFPTSRTVEELKDRYYNVCRALVVARAPSPVDVSGHPVVKEPYNVSQEKERKRALSMVLSQTKLQEKKDVEVLSEAKKITESRLAAKVAEEVELPVASNVATENTEKTTIPGDIVSPSPSVPVPSAVVAAVPSTLAADNAATVASLRMVNLKPRVPTKAVCAEHLELRKEILTLLNLQKQVQYKETENSSFRDNPYEAPGTPKDRMFVPDSMNFGGERPGKRDQKRKGPGRGSEAPSSPAQSNKRPRKLKASDL